MSKISFLSWNIENLGDKKVNNSGGQIFNLIAFVAKQVKADVIGLMEMPITAPSKIKAGILIALEAVAGGKWSADIINPGRKETYILLWRTDRFFKKKHSDLTEVDGNNKELKFPTASGKIGGRPAAYCCFQDTTKNDAYFNYVAFHAPGPGGAYTAFGGHQLSKSWPLYKTKNKTAGIPVKKVVVGGDFNVLWDDANNGSLPVMPKTTTPAATGTTSSGRSRRNTTKTPEVTNLILPNNKICYNSLSSTDGPSLKSHIENTRTTLKNDMPNGSLANFDDCKASSYDHFYEKGLTGTVASDVVPILDWLNDGTAKVLVESYKSTKAVNSGELEWEKAPHEWNDRLTKRDAWLFYRRLVSDHLPVSLSGNV